MDMEVLTRPHRFLREEFGRDFTLIYGDVDGEDVVLYATQPLEGYERQGDVFVKRVDPSTVKDRRIFGQQIAFPFPIISERRVYEPPYYELKIKTSIRRKPNKTERKIYGVNGSYAYIGSTRAVIKFDIEEQGSIVLNTSDLNSLKIPEDIIIAHEGTHLAVLRQRISPEYYNLIDEYNNTGNPITRIGRVDVLGEVTALWGELKYLLRFHPELEVEWKKWRSQSNGFAHHNAYRILTEHPDKVAEMVGRAKNS